MVLAEQIKEAASRRDTLEKCLDIDQQAHRPAATRRRRPRNPNFWDDPGKRARAAVAPGGVDQELDHRLRHDPQGGRGSGTDARFPERGGDLRGGDGCALCADNRPHRSARTAQHVAPRRGQDGRYSGHQRRSRRYRGARLGVDAAAHVHPLVRGPRLQGQDARLPGGRRGGRQVLHARNRGRLRLRLSQKRKRRAPHGASVAFQRQQQAPDDLRVGLRVARCGRFDRGRSSTPRTSSGTRSARRAPAVRTSTRSRRPCGCAITARIPIRANRSSS